MQGERNAAREINKKLKTFLHWDLYKITLDFVTNERYDSFNPVTNINTTNKPFNLQTHKHPAHTVTVGKMHN